MKRMIFILLAILLLTMPDWATIAPATASATGQESNCLFFTETVEGGERGFSVCDDQEANFRTPFERWGLQKIGYPISRRYDRDGFVTQAFQKAIMQWRPDGNYVALVNIFDDLHNAGFDDFLLRDIQTPRQLPAGWDGDIPFDEVVKKRQALLYVRTALQETYFASSDPLTFYGLPTSEVQDMGNHYAIRLQRAVLQEWKEDVPWAKEGEVTIANGGDIAKRLGGLPQQALIPESDGNQAGGTPSLPSLATASFQLSSVELMRWANNGTLAVATENSILLYDTNALDSEPRQLSGDIANVTSLAVSQDSLWLAAGLESGQILLWSLANNDQPNVLADHTTPVEALAFSPNGNRLLSGGGMETSKINGAEVIHFFEDTDVRVWDIIKGSKVAQLSNPRGRVTALAISADGTTVVVGTNDALGRHYVSCDGSIQYWDFESGAQIGTHRVGHPIWFNPDGEMGIARQCDDPTTTIQLWQTSSRTVVREFNTSTEHKHPTSLTLSQNGATLAAAVGRLRSPIENLVVWDVATGAELAVLPSDTWTIALNPNGDLLASGNLFEYDVHLWEIGASDPLAIVGQHYEPARHMAFSPDGSWLASATFGGTLEFANVQSLSEK